MQALLSISLYQCTDTIVNLRPEGQWAFSARTLDDTKLYMATLEVNARNRPFVSDSPRAIGGGLKWMNRYGFVGITWAADSPGVYDDGMNEHGLSVAQNQLDETAYPNVTKPGKSIGMRSVVGWLLGNARDIDEARALLNSGVQIWGRAGGGPGGDAGAERQHLHILDAHGGELLVEWTGGQQHLYGKDDGVWGTTTNSPDFPTMRAMRQYELSFPTAFSSPATTSAISADTAGRGGINGVPSAFDSWSRQARARMFNSVNPVCATQQQAVAWSFKLIDALSVLGTPFSGGSTGTSKPLPADGVGDFTQWQVVRDHRNRVVYSRTWDNMLPKSVHLDKQNFTEGSRSRKVDSYTISSNPLIYYDSKGHLL